MEASTKLQMLKIDLGITTDAYDNRLAEYLTYSADALETEGITPANESDDNLIVMYAAWLWRKRDTGECMPRMLRWMINNRLFTEKVQ